MSQRISFLKQLIAQQRQMGFAPAEIHMNPETAADFSREIAEMQPDTRSAIDRLRGVPKPTLRAEMFDCVRIVENPMLEGSAIVIRPVQLMDDPQWLEHVYKSRPVAPSAVPQHVAKSADMSEGTEGSVLAQLTQNSGITPSTVLIKAMENLDRVEDVIVLRFYKGGAIDMAATMNRFGVIGALQASLSHVMQGND